MNLFSDLLLLERLDHLIRTRATGSPIQLASRLDTSERNIYRLIGRLRDLGFPIVYDKNRDTYCYEEPVKIEFNITVGNERLLMIKGGKKNFYPEPALPVYGSAGHQLCVNSSPVAYRAREGEEDGVSRKPGAFIGLNVRIKRVGTKI